MRRSAAPLAQRIERIASDDEVGGSNPSRRAAEIEIITILMMVKLLYN